MSIGDFSPMIQVQNNPILNLTSVGTSANGTSNNGSNQVNGTVSAFWFILGDAIVGFFYTVFNMSGSGNVTFDLNWTNTWANGFKTPLRYYSSFVGSYEDAATTFNFLVPHEGQGHLDFIVNGQWGNQANNQGSLIVIYKPDS